MSRKTDTSMDTMTASRIDRFIRESKVKIALGMLQSRIATEQDVADLINLTNTILKKIDSEFDDTYTLYSDDISNFSSKLRIIFRNILSCESESAQDTIRALTKKKDDLGDHLSLIITSVEEGRFSSDETIVSTTVKEESNDNGITKPNLWRKIKEDPIASGVILFLIIAFGTWWYNTDKRFLTIRTDLEERIKSIDNKLTKLDRTTNLKFDNQKKIIDEEVESYIKSHRTIKELEEKIEKDFVGLRKKVGYFTLLVKPYPPDSKIMIKNIVEKYKPEILLKPGKYRIIVSAAGYQNDEQWITIKNKDVIRIVDLKRINK